ncbi:uncharacterized protein LOC143567548 [Bidens hawaiensis]|uniref:uncharacterized protein LOC143567548 n=1 Tax=Bidens hawaiensis TaxID=980011 RepID=UPI00404A02A3
MKPEISGRLAKWAIELGEYTIEYKPQAAFKGQVIADFLTEAPPTEDARSPLREKDHKNMKTAPQENAESLENQKEPVWNLYTDGASNEDGSGAGLILISLEGTKLTYAVRLNFPSTNNEAEYEALLAGLRVARKIPMRRIKDHVDSLLVANQISGDYEVKDPKMVECLKKTRELLQGFEEAKVIHISRGQNKKADALSKLASVAFDHLAKDVKIETIKQPSILEKVVASVGTPGWSWMTPILRYLQAGILPEDRQEAHRLRIKALQYEIINGVLYWRSYLGPSLKCIDYEEAKYIIREIHEGICGMHMGAKMLAARAMRARYYWPSMFLSALREIRKCDSCQIYAPMTRKPKLNLIPVSSSWPFRNWGIDIVGPFPEGSGKAKFLPFRKRTGTSPGERPGGTSESKYSGRHCQPFRKRTGILG